MAERVTTLFIRDDAVNLLVVEGKRVEKWVSLLLEPGLVSEGIVQDEARVADELSKLFKMAKIEGRRVVTGIGGLNSIYRLVSLPELPEAILPEAVKQEARRVIPVPLEEVYLSYQRLPAPPGETRLFLAAFPRNVVDVLVSTLRQAGVQPYIMDLAPLALCRTLDEPRAIIINSRLDHLDVVIMDDRLPQLIHRLSLPGEVVSLEEKVAAISEEIDRTVAFYNSSHRDNLLNATVPMFVCGDLAQFPESWQSLGGKLGCPVSILQSPMESPDGFDPSDFMVNIGLALKKLQHEREGANFSLVNFNALPEVYLPKGVSLSNIIVRVGAVIGIALLVGMGFMVYSKMSSNSTLRSQLSSVQSRIPQELEEMKALQDQIGQVTAQIGPTADKAQIFSNTLVTLEAGRERMNNDVAEAIYWLPAVADLTWVNHDGNSITVGGIAPDEGEIFIYARELREKFANVIISSVEAQVNENDRITGFKFELVLTK